MGGGESILDRLRLAHPELAPRLKAGPAEVDQEPAPFWKRHVVRRVTFAGRTPSVLSFADDGVNLVRLGGPRDIAVVNQREGLHLFPQHAEAYLRFYLRRGGVRALRLAEHPGALEWRKNADPARRAAAERAVRPIRIVLRPEGGYAAAATGVIDEDLIELQLELRGDGMLREEGRRVIEASLPLTGPGS